MSVSNQITNKQKITKLLQFAAAALRIAEAPRLPPVFKDDLYKVSLDLTRVSDSLQATSHNPVSDKETTPTQLVAHLVSLAAVLHQAGFLSKDGVSVLRAEQKAFHKFEQPGLSLDAVFQEETVLTTGIFLPAKGDEATAGNRSVTTGTSRSGGGNNANKTKQKNGSAADSTHRNNSPSPREETIRDFLKNNGFSSISEIAAALPNVSNKTVQRDLQNMIDNGVIIKEGERRWSRYKLAR